MLLNLIISTTLIVATTAIHASGMIVALHIVQHEEQLKPLRRMRIYRISGIVLLMFLVTLLEVLLWAGTYLLLGAFDVFEEAVYFSMVTYSTLGYGEIVLDERWRLLSSFEAANGIIMFGWTTAIIIAAVHPIYFGKKEATSEK